jgi:Flp pilus assembly protein TadB
MKIGFLGLLTIVFIVLKLVGVIAWSWLWVLSPLWVPLVAVIVIMLMIAMFSENPERHFK